MQLREWMYDHLYTLDQLEDMAVIEEGWTANLVEQDRYVKVWWERIDRSDGMPWDETVTVEARTMRGAWRDVFSYNAEDHSEFCVVNDDETFEIDN